MITKIQPGVLHVHNYLSTHYQISDLIDKAIKVSPVLLDKLLYCGFFFVNWSTSS